MAFADAALFLAAFLLALRDVAEALQMSKVAVAAGVNRENLYRMLSGRGNPRFSSLLAVMKALDCRSVNS